MVSKGDFHCHSTASDGVLSPTELIKLAYDQGVRVMALTDHDSTEGIAEARQAVPSGLTLIPGVEMGTDIPGSEVHMLGLYLEPDNPELQGILGKLRDGRLGRGEGIVKKLREMELNISWEQVQRIAGDAAVGRPHIATALVDNGQVATVKEAFDKYIARDGPAYVERDKMTPVEAVETIVRMGGIPCIAHPRDLGNLDDVLVELKAAGMVGMEVYYKDYAPNEVERLRQLSEKHDLLALGGSDYHGLHGPDEPLPGGQHTPVPEESIQALLALGRERTAGPAG
ncbi:MAG: PHP domain-containing protein [Chloroflexi bacterium]|nr:PHP domain-containing protein [Chloroflexota bacterium]